MPPHAPHMDRSPAVGVTGAPPAPSVSPASPDQEQGGEYTPPTFTSPPPVSESVPRPSLQQVQAGAEAELKLSCSHEGLRKALSTREACEESLIELSVTAAKNYQICDWKRHSRSLDVEAAKVFEKKGHFERALPLYENLFFVYQEERWQTLCLSLLPRMKACQVAINDVRGQLTSHIRLLSLDPTLVPPGERLSAQESLERLAGGGVKEVVALEASALLSFSILGPKPLEVGEGDVGTVQLVVWSTLPKDLQLDSLSFSLVMPPNFNPEDGVKVRHRPLPSPAAQKEERNRSEDGGKGWVGVVGLRRS